MKNILVKGAGVGGLVIANMLIQNNINVTVSAPNDAPIGSASWYAGGMLAPYCERESAEQIVQDLGLDAMKWWAKTLPNLVIHHGTLVIAPARDNHELERFSKRTQGHRIIDEKEIALLEPDLAGRFNKGLFYETESHIDVRKALLALKSLLISKGVPFIGTDILEEKFDLIIDATGIARLNQDKHLRGVRGEMLLVKTKDVSLSRPVRLLHPRIPLYIVPRENNIFMIGATMIESDFDGAISARSMMEFLNAAYTLHPAFAEAEIMEAGVAVRPSYPDNFPRVQKTGKLITVNGFYRHGFLLAPKMAKQAMQLAKE